MSTTVRDGQTFRLPDGRLLGFAEYGSPDGAPLLYFHGYPASRIEGGPASALARRQGIRLIALDRPGFGLSTPQPHRRISDWPDDVRAFAKGMDLDRFGVFGLSGGGPYALACARFIPKEMLTGVGLFITGPHWAAGRHQMTWIRRVASVWSTNAPRSMTIATDMLVAVWKWFVSTNFVTKRIDKWLDASRDKKNKAKGGVEDDNVIEWMDDRPIAEKREALIDLVLREPFAQGSEAFVHEAMLLSSQDWGFKLEDVDYDEIKMWHGVEDKNAPIGMIRWMAKLLPHANLREFEGETHYTMWKHMEGAVGEVVPAERKKTT